MSIVYLVYVFEYIEQSFAVQAKSIVDAVASLVNKLDKNCNPANVDFTFVAEDGNDLGEDGLYAAEIALAEYYN